MRRLANLQERTAPRTAPAQDAGAALDAVEAAMNGVDAAIGKLNEATGKLIPAMEATPVRRDAFVFANFVDNLGGSLGELDEMLDPIRAHLGRTQPRA